MRPGQVLGRSMLAAAAVLAAALALAGPAAAHVEVSADKPQAGAVDVTVTFVAESESDTTGIVSLRVVLPAGITPAQVSYLSGPPGWTLTSAADGYTVAGPAVPPGQDATYLVKIAQLPADATSLAFRTLQTYSDGHVDRWIEIPTADNPEPEDAAPVLTVAGAPTPASTSAAPAPTPSLGTDPTTAPGSAVAAGVGESAGGWPWPALGAGIVVLVAAAAAWWWRSRRRAAASDGR